MSHQSRGGDLGFPGSSLLLSYDVLKEQGFLFLKKGGSTMRSNRCFFLFLFTVLFLFVFPFSSLAQFQVNNLHPLQGALLIVQVFDVDTPPTGTFAGHPLTFWRDGEEWLAFYGISYWMNPGNYSLSITGFQEVGIQVEAGHFPESRLTVSREQEELISPEPEEAAVLKRREQDREKINAAYSQTNEEFLWQGPFIWPAKGRITTGFGFTRFVNDRLTGRHSGIDIAAPEGTPILASNSGQVRLAEELLVTGKTIIIDHGWGIYSSYSHLSHLMVDVGDRVEKGETIGLMGSTGFSTGSHLHWVIRTREAFLDPEQFLAVDIREMISPEEKGNKFLYFVQVGPFAHLSSARLVKEELEEQGFSGFVVEGETIRVQLGAFRERENAQHLYQKLIQAGYAATMSQ